MEVHLNEMVDPNCVVSPKIDRSSFCCELLIQVDGLLGCCLGDALNRAVFVARSSDIRGQ